MADEKSPANAEWPIHINLEVHLRAGDKPADLESIIEEIEAMQKGHNISCTLNVVSPFLVR